MPQVDVIKAGSFFREPDFDDPELSDDGSFQLRRPVDPTPCALTGSVLLYIGGARSGEVVEMGEDLEIGVIVQIGKVPEAGETPEIGEDRSGEVVETVDPETVGDVLKVGEFIL